ncbi:chemotaxis protein CheX [Rhodobacter aestuarii]|uniref:Chemotaxis protein CheX n=1 Tax=Rhodobacter aestuarii TaxID=453582 RepID=A0A1N7J9X7_9RHOB|nr:MULTISPECIES: STAS domain-containing protein [Rhodobacter]PTV97023.1 chemotaxis protein CheX [Rhodobacter aestuarii]SIS46061.1 chemotaxis protein CheX [Rhodobacter aestuarii]SOB98312.1 chemotaxis protein CheX [Rhodobacter sp. JA431]
MQTITLAPRLDLSQVRPLATTLREASGTDLVIDASGVTHLGGLAFQVIASAAKDAQAAGTSFTITPRSEAFEQALELFGLVPADLQTGEAA